MEKYLCKSPRIKLLPLPEGTFLRLRHLHKDNSDEDQREGPKGEILEYVTIAQLYNEHEEIVGFGISFCSPRDVPNRKLGYAIARNRAIKEYRGL